MQNQKKEKIPKPGETWGESEKLIKATLKVAQRTGLEPATPGVTGRYSNQLNYRCIVVGGNGIEPLTLCL